MLPENFQYFGWVGILWYILQGGFAGLIIKRISANTWFSIIGSLFFTMSAFMAYRMLNHTALAAHFLILAAVYVCITKNDTERSLRQNCVIWGLLLGLTAGIHIYLLVMLFGIMCFYFLDDLLEYKKIKKTVIGFCVPLLVVLTVFFVYGVFHTGADNTTGGLGNFSGNLNQIINPNAVYADIGAQYSDYSIFLKPLPLIAAEEGFITDSKQSEGNVYIGLGMIFFFFISLAVFIADFREYKTKLSDKRNLRQTILAITMFFAFYIFALSPIVTLGNSVVFDYSFINRWIIRRLLDIFRATGRFAWVSVYILMIVILWIAAKKYKKPVLIIIASVLVCIQCIDISGYFIAKGEIFRNRQVYETNMTSEIWNTVARDFDHVVYLDHTVNRDHVFIFASHNGLTVNDTYLARKDTIRIEAFKRETREMLYRGIAEYDKIYIFGTVPEELIIDNKLVVYMVDDMIIGFAKEVENAEYMSGVVRITADMLQ